MFYFLFFNDCISKFGRANNITVLIFEGFKCKNAIQTNEYGMSRFNIVVYTIDPVMILGLLVALLSVCPVNLVICVSVYLSVFDCEKINK